MLRLAPNETESHVDYVEHLGVDLAGGDSVSVLRAECPRCLKTFAGGSVVTTDPYMDPAEDGLMVRRHLFFCDHCRLIFNIVEELEAGLPTGNYIKCAITRGRRSVEAVLAKYPQLRGVCQC